MLHSCVCNITFRQMCWPLPLRRHTQSFRNLRQLLKIHNLSDKKSKKYFGTLPARATQNIFFSEILILFPRPSCKGRGRGQGATILQEGMGMGGGGSTKSWRGFLGRPKWKETHRSVTRRSATRTTPSYWPAWELVRFNYLLTYHVWSLESSLAVQYDYKYILHVAQKKNDYWNKNSQESCFSHGPLAKQGEVGKEPHLCGTPCAPDRNTRAKLIIKYYFLGKNRMCSFGQKHQEIFLSQFLVTPEGLLCNHAQIRDDLT